MEKEAYALVGVAVGSFLNIVNEYYKERRNHTRLVEGLKASLASEIASLIEAIERFDTLARLDEKIEGLETGMSHSFAFSAAADMAPVFKANIKEVGHLGEVAPKVVRFYFLLDSCVETGKGISATVDIMNGLVDPSQARIAFEHEQLLRGHKALRDMLIEIVVLGPQTIKDLGHKPFFYVPSADKPVFLPDDYGT